MVYSYSDYYHYLIENAFDLLQEEDAKHRKELESKRRIGTRPSENHWRSSHQRHYQQTGLISSGIGLAVSNSQIR